MRTNPAIPFLLAAIMANALLAENVSTNRWPVRSAARADWQATGSESAPHVVATAFERLALVISTSRKLVALQEELDARENQCVSLSGLAPETYMEWRSPTNAHGFTPPTRFPRSSHTRQYEASVPWSWAYAPRRTQQRSTNSVDRWPFLADAPALRELLDAPDPAMRAMAAEALATLHQPEDLPHLSRLLGDVAHAAPRLGHNLNMRALRMLPPLLTSSAADPLDVMRSWQEQTVATCARRSIRLMTGLWFADGAAFTAWWKNNSGGPLCLWYWQQRLQREMDDVDDRLAWEMGLPQAADETWETRRQRQQARADAARVAVSRSILAELRQMPAEVEAKVRLLTVSDHAGGAPVTGSECQFWPDPPNLRLPPIRLLDLLDRKALWADVAWDEQTGKGYFNLLVERLGLWADTFFVPADVPRLRAALQREHDALWWSGQAAMIIGISHLLPTVRERWFDLADTRAGFLKQAIAREPDEFVRGYCAKELVRVGLPENADYLHQIAFSPMKKHQGNEMAQYVLQALAERPLTRPKRELLVDLLLDRRFEPLWTRPNTRMGEDMCRTYGIWAVNAHAGRELVDGVLKQGLVEPARSAQSLKELRRRILQLREEPAVSSADSASEPKTRTDASKAVLLPPN